MKQTCLPLACLLLLSVCISAQAQTSYPMLMSLKPVAAQAGQTSEHVISSRYNMYGAYKVLVTGEGVRGEIVPHEDKEKDGEEPNLQKLKVRFHIDADAKPGVRDFRLATPQGATTVGQLVIVPDPVTSEKGNNNTFEQAQEVSLPATLCGAIERSEDVDYFKFQVEDGQAFSFHVRSMRLQNKIHDLQQHSDPIISLKNSSGSTLAISDNHFFGDPFLTYRFEKGGEYYLEIRDVRYQGNSYWEYSIEASDRPFVTNVHPIGVARGEKTKLQTVGFQLEKYPEVTLDVPANVPSGPQWLRLPLGKKQSNPAPVVVSDLPLVVETDKENNTAGKGQKVSIPAGISGRIETERDIDCFTFEAKKGEKLEFEVIARRMFSGLDSNMRILNHEGKRLSENDDFRNFSLTHADSKIENWTVPADGKYSVEIRDLHLCGGEEFVYFLKITRSHPEFELFVDTDKTLLTPGTGGVMFVRIERKNGFKGEVQLAIDGLPEGVTAHCGKILPHKNADGCIILEAKEDAPLTVANVNITGRATYEGKNGETVELEETATPYQEIYRPGGGRSHWPVEMHTVSVGEPSDIRSVELSTYEVTLKPGETQRIDVTIERAPGFEKNISLDMLMQHLSRVYGNPLPKGVSIDGKNSKTVLSGKETKGHISLKVAKDAPPVENQQTSVMANISLNFVMKATYSSRPLSITVTEP